MTGPRARVLLIAPGQGSRGGMNSMLNTVMGSELSTRYELKRLSLHRDGTAVQKAGAAVTGYSAMTAALSTFEPDLVWVHATKGASFQRKSLAILLARAAGVPSLLHLHSVRAVEYLEGAGRPVRWLARFAMERSAATVVLDPSWSPRLARLARTDYHYVPNPVDVPIGVNRDGAVPGRIVQVGTLAEAKGVFTSLAAFDEIRRSCPWATLHFLGDGPAGAELRRRVERAGMGDAVTFHGWLAHDRVLRIVESSECLILPSAAEGLPISLLEAMARAVPTIATPVGGIPDMLDGGVCGLLVPVGLPEPLAAGVVRLLRDPAYAAELGGAGRAQVLAHYSTPVFVDRMSSILDCIIGREP